MFVWPGVCEDDADARHELLVKNLTGFKVTSARGTGLCTCLPPFFGPACQLGQCPAGERLDRNAAVEMATGKYVREACVPCAPGAASSRYDPETCTPCPEGFVPNRQKNDCEECTG